MSQRALSHIALFHTYAPKAKLTYSILLSAMFSSFFVRQIFINMPVKVLKDDVSTQKAVSCDVNTLCVI